MAILTKTEKYVAETYAKYFGRAADADKIKEYGFKENGKAEKASVILANIIADADAEKAGLSTSEFVDNAFQNLFGRDATTKEMNKYSKVIDAGKNLPIQSIVKSATKTDKAVYNNKMAVAAKYAELGGTEQLDLSKISKDNIIELNFLNTVTKAADLKAKVVYDLPENSGVPSAFDGKTFTLTEGVDAGKDFTGTDKKDLFIADNSVNNKVNATAADTLDGGKGVDTFKIYDVAAGGTTVTSATLPTLKNIENVALYNLRTGDLDVKKWDTVGTLKVVNAAATTGGAAKGFEVGEKVTTVNFEDIAAANSQVVTFDKDLTATTLGVNKVGITGGAATSVTVNGTALKKLTVDAYGKESNVTLVHAAGTIDTLNITGKADLTLSAIPASIITVDGSKAEGDLKFSNSAAMTSVKTGSGDDEVTVAAGTTVAAGETINLGAGNDKLVAGATTSKVAAGSIIDGGDGIDSLDSALVNVGNAGVFAGFETLTLTTDTAAGADLDVSLLNKSTITTIAIDYATGAGAPTTGATVRNVSKSQSLTVNANTTLATELKFKDVAGTADAYTINFGKETTGIVDAGTVTIDGIETVTVNSLGKTSAATDTNKITLVDANAKSLVITGDKALTVAFGTGGFGSAAAADATNGLGVSTIDASASTAGIKIATGELAKVNSVWSGLTIKGGAGDDSIVTGAITKAKITALTIDSGAGNDILDLGDIAVADGLTKADIKVNAGAGDDIITVGQVGGTFTLGAGKDTITVTNATVAATTTVATGAIKTTITNIEKGDQIVFGAGSTLFAKVDISTAVNLDQALGLAAASNAVTTWFQFSGKTYIVDDNNNAGTLNAADIVVELNGLVDLGNSTLAGGTLTIA